MHKGAVICNAVSTHSRPKAAGLFFGAFYFSDGGFNTQPPEGGWIGYTPANLKALSFNTQPPEGGWANANKRVVI